MNTTSWWSRYPRLPVWIGVAVFSWTCFFSINKPLTTDEAEFGAAVKAILEEGRPLYYVGDTPLQYRGAKDHWVEYESPKPQHFWGLWHTGVPYLYAMAASCSLFGMSNWAARLPGLLCLMTTLWLLLRILRQLVPPAKVGQVLNWCALLYLVNPLIIQQGLMVDVDNTVVTLATVLFLHEYIRMERSSIRSWRRFLWLTLLMVLGFWAKEFPPLYLGLALTLYNCLRRRWAEAGRMVGMMVAAAGLFWITWWTVCRGLGMPVMYFIRFTIGGKLAIGEGLLTTIIREAGWGPAAYAVFHGFLSTAVWTSPYYVVLGVSVVVWRVAVCLRTRRVEGPDLLLLYVLVTVAATQIYRPSGWYLKYQYPLHPLLILLVALLLTENVGGPVEGVGWLGPGLAVGLAVAQWVLIGDPVFWFFNMGLPGLRQHHVEWFYLLAFVVLFMAFKFRYPGRSWIAGGLAALATGCLGSNLGLNLVQTRSYTTTISSNNYGEAGFTETVEYLTTVLQSTDEPIVRKDIGFYLGKDPRLKLRKWHSPVVLVYVRTAEELVQNITQPHVNCIILERFSIRRDVLPLVQRYYAFDRQCGDFYVFRRRT